MTIRHSITVMAVLFAACCALAATGCSDSTQSEAPEQVAAPLVVRYDRYVWEPPALTEAAILADRILRREDDGLLLDAVERQELANELWPVLSRIRDAYPAVADIDARMPYGYGELLLGLEPPLFEDVAELFEVQTGPVVRLRTGQPEFDALNARLGLTAVRIDGGAGFVLFYFDSEYVNVLAAAAAYEAVEGIRSASPNIIFTGASDIDAVESEGDWYVLARPTFDPCSRGPTFFFFIVNGTDVERVDDAQALGIAEFRELHSRSVQRTWVNCPDRSARQAEHQDLGVTASRIPTRREVCLDIEK